MNNSSLSLSASVTRILSLHGFPKELKTRDIQAAFSDWDNVSGGFKIKWVDDTSLLIVFADAGVAKRAYLQMLAAPPAILSSPTAADSFSIQPYDGPDALNIIQNVNSRHGNARSRASISVSNGVGVHVREPSVLTSVPSAQNIGREPSPTLPSLPTHPTLNSLISSSLSSEGPLQDPAIVETSGPGAPRIGDPGKRMIGSALGVRHPNLGNMRSNGSNGGNLGTNSADQALREVEKAMGGLAVHQEE